MAEHVWWRALLLAAIAFCMAPQFAAAQSRPEFIAFPDQQGRAVPPDAGPPPMSASW